jgi:glycosyltransferase involved in cell wall biosynthesis
MKILLHALGVSMGGAKRHFKNLLDELAKDVKTHKFVILGRESLLPLVPKGGMQFIRFADRKCGFSLSRLFSDTVRTPELARRHRCDVIVSLTNYGPILTPVPHIVFQRNALLFSPLHLSELPKPQQFKMRLQRQLAIASMKKAQFVVTPSRAMAELIKSDCPSVREKDFRILYHGFSAESMNSPLNSAVSQLLDRPEVKLLYPAHGAIHKGFFDLLRLLQELRRHLDYTLFTTIGEESPALFAFVRHQLEIVGLQRNVVFTGQVPQSEMGGLYRRCDVMIYPSLLEAFGYAMVEAMGHELPIVAAGTPVNREICGAAAEYYDPGNPTAGANAVLSVLAARGAGTLGQQCHTQLAALGCSWAEYRTKFVALIESVH